LGTRGILPNFLIVGAQKCGTTSLHDILSRHPQVQMSEIKEVNFFINPHKYDRGLDYYSTFFNQKENAIAIGESSPGYLCYPEVYNKIKEDLGNIKIVILLRDPIKRAFSQYWDNRRQLNEPLTEVEIIDNYLESEYNPKRKGYFSRGVYYPQVRNYIESFGADYVHVILLEELIKHQQAELHKLYRFLGLDKDKGYQKLPKPSNSSLVWDNPLYKYMLRNPKQNKFLPSKLRRLFFFGRKKRFQYDLPNAPELERLKAFYKPWNQKLEEEFGLDIQTWIS